MKKLIPILTAALCVFLASCAMSDVRAVPPPRMIADVSPIDLGTFEVFTDKFFSSDVGKEVVTLIYEPRTDELQINYRNTTGKSRLFLSEGARALFVESFSRYEALYESKTLQNGKGTGDAFGTFPARLRWGGMMSLDAEGLAILEYGYLFRDQAPWFCLTVPITTNDKYNEAEMNYSKNSSPKYLLFNRAKAAEFAALLDQAMLEAMVSGPTIEGAPPSPGETDLY